ncbi:MAG: DASS family sodium-coupled anion symporter, partial [Armatimonadetes bacterium]|nr:DASS family sodium-coupled anion symporter [Armatimonadota bacterium]
TLVTWLGRSTLGLGYAIGAAELTLGPVVPSNTARGGGILAPIVDSLSGALGSSATESPERAGRYLILVGSHSNLITAAMFLTGMAANPLVSAAASEHLGVDFGWGTWALGAIVPGLVGLALLPLFVYQVAKPTISDAGAAREQARASLAEMGPWSRGQITLAIIFVLLLALWSTKGIHGFDAALVAWVGVCALVVTGTEKWDDIIGNAKAWDTLIWLGGLLAMANALMDTGVVNYFTEMMQGQVAGMAPVAVVLVLCLIYFYSMYGFSMFTAHIAAFVGAFFVVAATTQAPPVLMVAMFAYFSNLCGCTTNYSTGPVVIYFGLGYVPVGQWFRVGALMSLFHLSIWLTVGMAWWKLLGWW